LNEHGTLENILREKMAEVNYLSTELQTKYSGTLTVEKKEEIMQILRNITSEKNNIEEKLFKSEQMRQNVKIKLKETISIKKEQKDLTNQLHILGE
jgi:arginine deiminase